MGKVKFVGGAVGSPEVVCRYVSSDDNVVMPTSGCIPKPAVVEDVVSGSWENLLGSAGTGDDLTIVTAAGVIVAPFVVAGSSPTPMLLLAGC